jgi:outer membrane protein OmpA-like peptidoglycan-associated protein
MGVAILAAIFAAIIVFGREPRTYDETVIVLPAPEGKKIGGVVVMRDGQQQVLDSPYAASRVSGTGSLEASRASPAEVQQSFSDVLTALPPRPAKFVLYFITGKDVLTDESAIELRSVLAEMKKRPVPDVLVIGHTDTQGDLESNDELSRMRAEKVKGFLVGIGVAPERIKVAGRGERELLVPTADNVDEPRNRRVEINVR